MQSNRLRPIRSVIKQYINLKWNYSSPISRCLATTLLKNSAGDLSSPTPGITSSLMSLTASHEVSKWDRECRGKEGKLEEFMLAELLGLEHEGQVRGIPILLYFEGAFFMTVGTVLEWTRNRIRALSRSSSER